MGLRIGNRTLMVKLMGKLIVKLMGKLMESDDDDDR